MEALQVTDEYGVYLTEITLDRDGPLPIRQVLYCFYYSLHVLYNIEAHKYVGNLFWS